MTQQYLDTLKHVTANGVLTPNRTGVSAYSVFGGQITYDLSKGFPLLTTKKIWWRGVVEELRWFLSGSTNVNDLAESVQKWWSPWAKEDGGLGPTYGKQLRRCGVEEYDQLEGALHLIQSHPTSRRILISLWHTPEMLETQLPCCHGTVTQFNVQQGKLSCHMYQRSADVLIGVPVNIASYALLTHLMAAACGLEVGWYTHSFGNLHLYENHRAQSVVQLARDVRKLPTLKMHLPKAWDKMSALDRVLCFDYDMLEMRDYDPHPSIPAPVAV